MLRTIWGDPERYKDTYWSRFADQGYYFAGDGAKKDEEGDIWLLGRVDDVMNVSGHRISTTEVESALVSHEKVAEAAVVGATDPTTGQGIVAFVILRAEAGDGGDGIAAELRSRDRSWWCRNCRRPVPARSCGGCCATSPRTGRWAMSPRSPTRR
jgi:acetyl-CoA synthetase